MKNYIQKHHGKFQQKTYQFYEFMYFETTFLFTFAGTI